MRAIRDVTLEASRDLGAGPWRTLRNVVLPQCESGIAVAFMFTFLISVGDYVTPRFVGGGAAMMGQFIETQFSLGFNWPMGSAMAFTIMALSLADRARLPRPAPAVAEAVIGRLAAELLWRAFTLAVVVFMATPLFLVVLFSFNRSALTSLPLTGLTLDWYRKLLANNSFWPALENSLIVGFTVAARIGRHRNAGCAGARPDAGAPRHPCSSTCSASP